jgi:hypothetical protein
MTLVPRWYHVVASLIVVAAAAGAGVLTVLQNGHITVPHALIALVGTLTALAGILGPGAATMGRSVALASDADVVRFASDNCHHPLVYEFAPSDLAGPLRACTCCGSVADAGCENWEPPKRLRRTVDVSSEYVKGSRHAR